MDQKLFSELYKKYTEEPSLADMYTGPRDAYKKAGGGIKGILSGTLAGIGSAAKIMNTPAGMRIMSYATDNPYLLPAADRQEASQAHQRSQILNLLIEDQAKKEDIAAQEQKEKARREQEIADVQSQREYEDQRIAQERAWREAQEAAKMAAQQAQMESETQRKTAGTEEERRYTEKQKQIDEFKKTIDADKHLTTDYKIQAKQMLDAGVPPRLIEKESGIKIPFLGSLFPPKTVLLNAKEWNKSGPRRAEPWAKYR